MPITSMTLAGARGTEALIERLDYGRLRLRITTRAQSRDEDGAVVGHCCMETVGSLWDYSSIQFMAGMLANEVDGTHGQRLRVRRVREYVELLTHFGR